MSKRIPLLIVLSGPEPQRSIFEDLVLEELRHLKNPVVLVRGLPMEPEIPSAPGNVTIYNHLPGEALCKLVSESEMVLARAGYSTIMDLVKLQQRAILVPTPGQAEQEYLASYLQREGLFYSCHQQHFNLPIALQQAEKFYETQAPLVLAYHENIITDWVESLASFKA